MYAQDQNRHICRVDIHKPQREAGEKKKQLVSECDLCEQY